MPMMPKTHRPGGAAAVVTNAERYRYDVSRRGTRTQQGYTNEWLRASADFRARHPLCAMCLERGKVTPSQCTDHVIPHRGDPVLFWSESNWQALCNPCHNGPKRIIEAKAAAAARIGAVGKPAGCG